MSDESPELYLIAHKVRGALAFDVAHKLQIGTDEGWIIPTSGHRAYPFWHAELGTVFCSQLWAVMPQLPEDLRDHYEVDAKPPHRPVRRAPSRTLTIDDLV